MSDSREEPLSERVSFILADQRSRWRRGETVFVESYFETGPELRETFEVAAELILSEIALRSERGESPSLEEYSRRFPEFADELRQQFAGGAREVPGASPALVTRTARESVAVAAEVGSPRASPPPREGPPERLGRYKVLSTLGTGGFGDVYLGYDGELDRQVAIKVPHSRHLGTRKRIDAFLNEARNMARLSHPAIVSVHDVGATEMPASSSRSSSKGGASPTESARGVSTRPRSPASRPGSRRRSTTLTPKASSTATSSPPTSCSMPRGSPTSRTSASRSRIRSLAPRAARSAARLHTWRPSRSAARTTGSARAPTCTVWES